jgi:hypothetical protein
MRQTDEVEQELPPLGLGVEPIEGLHGVQPAQTEIGLLPNRRDGFDGGEGAVALLGVGHVRVEEGHSPDNWLVDQALLDRPGNKEIHVAGVGGLAEREWSGRRARIGEALIGFKKLRGRCLMTTYDPDTLAHDPTVLRRIVREMGGRLALDTYVVRGGRICPRGSDGAAVTKETPSAGNEIAHLN